MGVVKHGGRAVGRMESETFVRLADPARHMLRSPEAWCHDDALLDQLERAGCAAIRIEARTGTGTGITAWMAPLAVIRRKGFPVHRPGWPEQTGLVLNEWATLQVRPATAADVAAMVTAIEAEG